VDTCVTLLSHYFNSLISFNIFLLNFYTFDTF
jgi:hypothetical protein